jgi:hypothetical protein
MAKVSMDTVQALTNKRTSMVYSAAKGNYKEFKQASKEYASLAVKNFELLSQVKAPSIKVPLFSAIGWNMFKVYLLNKLRIKTPDEKLLKKLGQEQEIKNKLNYYK